jgi:hypothetical protein
VLYTNYTNYFQVDALLATLEMQESAKRIFFSVQLFGAGHTKNSGVQLVYLPVSSETFLWLSSL